MSMLEQIENKMQKTVHNMHNEFNKLRTGRAQTSLLEHIEVEAYGSTRPLNQVASVVVKDSRTLSVSPWDKSLLQTIEKAIMQSQLGLNPNNLGQDILIHIPPLTEERRKEMVKLAKSEAEQARVAIRNLRREYMQEIKEALKNKEINEDQEHKDQQAIQKITDRFIEKIDLLLQEKEEDLLKV